MHRAALLPFAPGAPFPRVQTETFTALAVYQWFNVPNCRSGTRAVFGTSLLKTLWLLGGLARGQYQDVATRIGARWPRSISTTVLRLVDVPLRPIVSPC